MPHIHVHVSKGIAPHLNAERLLTTLAETLAGIETIRPEAVKAYLSVYENYAVGEGHPPEFAHCAVAILEGRPSDLRAEISDKLYLEFRRLLSDVGMEVGITLEVREMAKDTYRK
jgi:5-carboxymethyl-2-hydroxymuconate isomerase